MHTSQRVRFSASAASVAPSVRSAGIIGGRHARNATAGQVGGSTRGGGDGVELGVAHPLKISRTAQAAELRIRMDNLADSRG
jgi:hypothetical protein